MNVVRSNHDDQGGAVLALDRVGKLSQFGVDHTLGHGSGNEVRLTDKVGHEGCGRHVVHHLRRIELFQAAMVEDRDPIGHGKGLVMIVRDEHGRRLCSAQQVVQLLAHASSHVRVQIAEWLVEQQHDGILDEGTGQRDPLLLAS